MVKKKKAKTDDQTPTEEEVQAPAVVMPEIKTFSPVAPLTIDYPNDLLNGIARKVNEVIDRIN